MELTSSNPDEIELRFSFKDLKDTKSVVDTVKQRSKDSIIISLDVQQNSLKNVTDLEGNSLAIMSLI